MRPMSPSRLLVGLVLLMVPLKAVAQTPNDGAHDVPLSPKLIWPAVKDAAKKDAAKCDILLDQNAKPSQLRAAVDGKMTSYQVPNALEVGAVYYWEVSCKDSTGKLIDASIWSFTTATTQMLPSTGTEAGDTLRNLGFGVALSLQWNVLKPDIVNDAVVDPNGIVRVNTRSNTTAGFMLEMHYLVKKWGNDTRGIGPFVAVQPGTDQIISAVGAGAMIDWKVPIEGKRTGFGLGLGYAARPFAKTLGDEFVAGKPAPVGPNGNPLPIRFETRDKGSLLMVLSLTF